MPEQHYDLSDEELQALLDGELTEALQQKLQASPELNARVQQMLKIEQNIRLALTPPTAQQITDYVSGDLSPETARYVEFFMAIDGDIREEVELSRAFMSDPDFLIDASAAALASTHDFMPVTIRPDSEMQAANTALRSGSGEQNIIASAEGLEIAITMKSSSTDLDISGSIMLDDKSASIDETDATEAIVELWSAETLLLVVRSVSNSFHCRIAKTAPLEARFIVGRSHHVVVPLITEAG